MESNQNKRITSESDRSARHSGFLLKLTGWVLALLIVGTVVCVILGTLKTALQVVMIVGCVCLVLALLCGYGYYKIKARMHEHDD